MQLCPAVLGRLLNIMKFTVICNGCDTTQQCIDNDVRESLSISQHDFLFIFVGNITPNKNQTQVVEALGLLASQGIDNIKCLFIGGGDIDLLKSKVEELNVSHLALVLGYVDKYLLKDYYAAADATILTSLTEGFGLSIVEGYVYGKPNLTFADLPAVKDLYSADCMLLVMDRRTSSLAKCMVSMSSRQWNNERIHQFSQQFSLEVMARHYCSFYSQILNLK